MLKQAREWSIVQAVDRLRLADGDKRKVFILTNTPVPLEIEELKSLADIIGRPEEPWQAALDRLGGLYLSPVWMARNAPEVWPTEDAARKFAAAFQKPESLLYSNIKSIFRFLEEKHNWIVHTITIDDRKRVGKKSTMAILEKNSDDFINKIENELKKTIIIHSTSMFHRGMILYHSETLLGGKLLVFGGYVSPQAA